MVNRAFSSVVDGALALVERTRRPTLEGRIVLDGLTSPVEVIRDRWGVPHIYARNTRDLMFAQGFVHAQDRLWQMDCQRRALAGCLAEVLGAPALSVDRCFRILGLRGVAETELRLIDDGELCAELEAYAAGVNACIEREPLPIEFTLLRYRPQPWTPADSISWAKMMSWFLSVNWDTELLRSALFDQIGPELAAELEPPRPARCPVVTPSDSQARPSTSGGPPPTAAKPAPQQGSAMDPGGGRGFPSKGAGIGSNNWVVDGSRTITGKPLLANDMHLSLTTPAIWYENHLASPDLNVTGVSLPGVGYVVVGHNGHVAWGFTNGYPDVQDLFVERLRRTAQGGVEYEYRGEWLPAEVRTEHIAVKGQEPVAQEVVATRHGPIINELAPGLAAPAGPQGLPEKALALRWTALDPDTMLDAVRGLNRARSCDEVREALKGWATPVVNTVYADTAGNIGYSFPGRVPVRRAGDGRLPVPGWTDEFEWTGYLPFEELPHQYNPASGYVVSANNHPVDDQYPHFLGTEFCVGDRAQRIVELLLSRDRVDLAFFRQMQGDQYASSLHIVAQQLGRLQIDHPQLAPLVTLLRDWDGQLTADNAAGAVTEVFLRLLGWVILQARFEPPAGEESGPGLPERIMGAGPMPLLKDTTIFWHRTTEWLLALLEDEESHWYDLGGGERRDAVLRMVLKGTYDHLTKRLGPAEPPGYETWSWGRLHAVTFAHLLGASPALAGHFSRGPFPIGGDENTVWATGAGVTPADTTRVIGPPFRFIADLGDLSNSLGVLVPGNSGRPDSPHYDDQIEAWFEGRYHPMLWRREDVEREAEARLELTGA